ncbi:MAG: DMT family transporter [Acidimicrobiales bacterium]
MSEPIGRDERWRADLSLVGTAFLFGVTFVVVQEGVEDGEPFPFIAVRFLIGLVVLAPLAWRRQRTPGVWRDGIAAGVALAAGYAFQTTGLQYTTPSVSAFVTYLAVVFVPVLSTIVFRRPPTR